MSQTDEQGKNLYAERYLSLKYENLLDHPWEEMRRIWSFLEADNDSEELHKAIEREMLLNPDAEWQVQKAKDIAEPIQKGKRGNWHTILTNDDRIQFHRIAGKTLQSWGYPLE